MNVEQITAWAAEGESEILELKRGTGLRREAAQTVCAMLNHRGGRVLFGVEPDGRVVGQQVGERTIEEVVQELRQIEPPAFPDIDRVDIGNGMSVLMITVPIGRNRPYAYRGRAYRRLGNTTQVMTRDEYNRMLMERLHGGQRWEIEFASGWNVDDLDTSELVRTVDEAIRRGRMDDLGTRDSAELLRGLGLLRDGSLLQAAVVLFGRADRIEREYPQCLLRVARFRGTDRTEFLDNRQFHGHAFDLLRHAERFMRETLPVAGRVVPDLFERVDEPLYPLLALREALANAICHRDYSIGGGSVGVAVYDDRLEVTSSGALHFGLTVEALFEPHESLPWNPLIARVFFRRGIIETWGRGTIKMAELMQQAGMPIPEITDSGGCVTVRFRPSRYIPPQRIGHDLTARQRAILAIIESAAAGVALRTILDGLEGEHPYWEVKRELALLKELELIETEGRGRGAHWRIVRR